MGHIGGYFFGKCSRLAMWEGVDRSDCFVEVRVDHLVTTEYWCL